MSLIKSWVDSANSAQTPFPLNNLPCGVFSTPDRAARCGVAIGDYILDVAALERAGLLTLPEADVFAAATWNCFMALGRTAWAAFRTQVTSLLRQGYAHADDLRPHLIAQSDATLHMPISVTEFTDFYAGKQHAMNMGEILRGSPDLPANWLHIPIGYNGRASSVVVSGTDIRRPNGQMKAPDTQTPHFGPTQKLDIELELGAIVGTPSPMGQPITVQEADGMIFGYVLLNDWSARDIQGWEYQPLGPFQGKAFATTISPWIVTSAALAPFRAPTPKRDVNLLPYLASTTDGVFDIDLEVLMHPKGAEKATSLSKTNYARMYYSAAEQLCHHAVGGCGMRTGDLLGSGTISGPNPDEYGSLVEKSWAGREPFTLDTGETRSFVGDGDTLTLTGAAKGDGYTVGFGTCTGTILPALKHPK